MCSRCRCHRTHRLAAHLHRVRRCHPMPSAPTLGCRHLNRRVRYRQWPHRHPTFHHPHATTRCPVRRHQGRRLLYAVPTERLGHPDVTNQSPATGCILTDVRFFTSDTYVTHRAGGCSISLGTANRCVIVFYIRYVKDFRLLNFQIRYVRNCWLLTSAMHCKHVNSRTQ